MVFIGLLRPLLLLYRWKFLKQVARHLVADCGKFGSRGILLFCDDFSLLIDFLAVALPPNINDPNFAGFLDGRSRQLVEENTVGIMSPRFCWVDILIFHVLIGKPLFDLLFNNGKPSD